MGIINKAKNLFSMKKDDESTIAPSTANNEAKQNEETYKQYGFRVAGLSCGSIQSLVPHLQSVMLSLKREQAEDEILQNELKQQQQQNILNKEAEKKQVETDRKEKQDSLNDIQQKKETAKQDISELKSSSYTRNRAAWIQLVISGVLLIPFTIYFFVFYSSVAYSAFFEQFDLNDISNGSVVLTKAIFDGQAIAKPWNDGFFEMLFILLMPIIFLAFGFILNRWERENGRLKYIKIPSIILAAFIFDILLAYGICQKLYDLNTQMSLSNMPPYSMSLALQDPHFWVIICLGFVAYIIWGITFGYFITALDDLDLNKVNLERLEKELKGFEQSEGQIRADINSLSRQVTTLDAEINTLKLNLSNYTRYDIGKIKLELSNFYAGWQLYLATAERDGSAKESARLKYIEVINSLAES